MRQSTDELRLKFREDFLQVKSTLDLENIKIKFLGKKGPVTELMRRLKDVSSEERPEAGKLINDTKEWMTRSCEELAEKLTAQEENGRLIEEAVDVSLPGRRRRSGRRHPLSAAMQEIIEILSGMGFSVKYGPDIDTDYYNFEVLNFPPDHPARDMQDTFYISPHVLLRTHTSNIQARVMESHTPPIRIIAPGRAYRNETITSRSHVFFHQIEAVYIDNDVSFADLMATTDLFLHKLFKRKIDTRYRPSYFPFVEPGMEIDIGCLACESTGCSLCKQTGWLEIGGAGMIHPEVLRNGGIDPEQYSGFAWGMGLERIVMLLRGIRDIRRFSENDIRFLDRFTSI